jgi:stearoyl-CoA desaturase (delta-9 desaturase)
MPLEGLLNFTVLGYIGIALLLTHITIASVTIFLHRHQAHRALTLHPIVSHFFRFWLWLTTGMVTKQWVAIHRKHHAKCETEEDPHSPRHKGIGTVLLKGAWLYRQEAKNQETLEKYGHKTPDDWLERNVYSRFPMLGLILMGLIDLALFGIVGLAIFLVQIVWIPFWAAGVINGVGHYFGYRNFETADASTNIVPWGILIGGEELHNNHHAYGSSAKLSNKWWEFDLGWAYIRLLEMLRLAKVTRRAPKLRRNTDHIIDIETVRAVVSNRFHVLKLYGRRVTRPVLQAASAKANRLERKLLRRARKPMTREDVAMDRHAREAVSLALVQSHALATVYQFKQRLKEIWQQTAANQASRVQQLQAWCHEAEQTGIHALEEFARYLRGYSQQTA